MVLLSDTFQEGLLSHVLGQALSCWAFWELPVKPPSALLKALQRFFDVAPLPCGLGGRSEGSRLALDPADVTYVSKIRWGGVGRHCEAASHAAHPRLRM